MKKKNYNKFIGIIIVCIFLILFVSKNTKQYVMQDGVMLALTLTDEFGNVTNITSFPSEGNYHVDIDCTGGTGKYQPVRVLDSNGLETDTYKMKFTVEDITASSVKCNLDFYTITEDNKSNFLATSEVESKASDLGTATLVQDNSTFTPTLTLEQSSYTITTMETTSDNKDAFIWDDTAKTWTSQNHTASTTSNGGKGMSFTLPNGAYQICYTMYSEKNYDYGTVYIDGVEKFNTKGKDTAEYCENLGLLTSSNVIRVAYRKDGSGDTGDDNIVFYIKKGDYVEDIVTKTVGIGHRYSGKQPNNWVWFNNELWRIIGSIPTCMDSSCTTNPNLVKIMRAESIGTFVFDSTGKNKIWGETGDVSTDSTLYTLLNSYYYGKKDATYSSTLTSTPCIGYGKKRAYALCNFTNKGISDDSNDYYGRMIEKVYMNVGNASSLENTDGIYVLETATLTSSATPIGLMNISDYGYSASGQNYSQTAPSNSYTMYSWIFTGYEEWLISSSCHFYSAGNISCGSIDHGFDVRPVVYLDSSVYVISGEGTEGNPYQIGM